MAQPVVAQSAAVVLVCAFLSLLWPGGNEEQKNNTTVRFNYTEYTLRQKNPSKFTIDLPDLDFRRTHPRRYPNSRQRAFYTGEFNNVEPTPSGDVSGALVLHGSYEDSRDAYLNRMLLLNDTFQGGVVAIDVFNLFGALVLWMTVITSLVVVIIWLLCQNTKDPKLKIVDDIDGVKSRIEELQSSFGNALSEKEKEIERLRYGSSPSRLAPYLKSSTVTEDTETITSPRHNRTNTSNYDPDNTFDETRDYSRRYTRTYDKRRDEDERLRELDDMAHDFERRETERRREEDSLRKRQEQLDEQRRRRDEYYYDETRSVDENNNEYGSDHYKSELERAVQAGFQRPAMVKMQPKSRPTSGATTPIGSSSTTKANGSTTPSFGVNHSHHHDHAEDAPGVCITCQRVGRDHKKTAHAQAHHHTTPEPLSRKPVAPTGSVQRWRT